jgi:hypothetical protein
MRKVMRSKLQPEGDENAEGNKWDKGTLSLIDGNGKADEGKIICP